MALAKKNGKQIGNPNLKADNAVDGCSEQMLLLKGCVV